MYLKIWGDFTVTSGADPERSEVWINPSQFFFFLNENILSNIFLHLYYLLPYMDLYLGWWYRSIRMNKLCMEFNKCLFTQVLLNFDKKKNMYLSNLLQFKKKKVYTFFFINCLKKESPLQNPESTPGCLWHTNLYQIGTLVYNRDWHEAFDNVGQVTEIGKRPLTMWN